MSSSGRSTGTVPKVKSRPNSTSTRDQHEQRRTPIISNMPNNLQSSGLEWQHQQPPSSSRSRNKARNTRQQQYLQSLFDGSFDLELSHERLRPRISDASLRSSHSDTPMENDHMGYEDKRRCGSAGGDGISSQMSTSRSSQDMQPHNTLVETKNNISRIPDRNQVLSRLNQIRDYVKQTSALMDSLNGSSDPSHITQVIKLKNMNADLRDSESRLEQLLHTLNSLADSDELFENCSTPEHLERFTQLLDIVKTQEDTCLGLFKDGVIPEGVSPQTPPNGYHSYNRGGSESLHASQSSSRSASEEPGSLPTAAQYAKHQELKLKVEESQKKLLALQEHQAALVALQQKAQQQLREAQAQQGALLATATTVDGSPTTDNLNGRMKTLQDMLSNRNEVASLLEEQDEELTSEHTAIQERLDELQGRKMAIDRLVEEIIVLGESSSNHQAETVPHQNGQIQNDVDAESSEDEESAVDNVCDKLEELTRMKFRLAQLQSMVAAVNRGEVPHESVKAALANTNDVLPRIEQEQPTTRSRQHQDSGSSNKPDNIVLSTEGTPSYIESQVMDIKLKTDQLNKAKKRLKQLSDLLGAVGGNETLEEERVDDNSPQQTEPIINREIMSQSQNVRSEQTATLKSTRQVFSPVHLSNQAKNKNQEQRKTVETKRDAASSRQLALQAELQAKRLELEELMHKDQGQSSSINQDTCSETGFSLPETSATWGGSSSSQTALLATVDQEAEAQERSMVCSSDDTLDEPLVDSRTPTAHSNSRHRQQSVPSNAGASYQPPWQQFRPKYDSSRKDTTESQGATSRSTGTWSRPSQDTTAPTYELPGSVGSSGATPRPPSETGSSQSMPWWPIQVQQQLEATSAMCQAMMQQWQWGTPGPEPWWNPQGPALNQQQLVVTLSQCCHMLWMQHREIANLHSTMQVLQERIACTERLNLAAAAAGATAPPLDNNQVPHGAHHQPLRVSLSTGLFPDQAAANGVSSAHSLPNLCDGPPPASFVLPPPPQFPWIAPNSRSSSSTTTPNNPLPSMLRHGPPVTLNNQVPPGIRANNYWDNFRSYSRQNLLSASTKCNDGHSHHPNPIADRSHNSLRGAESQQQQQQAADLECRGHSHNPSDRPHNSLSDASSQQTGLRCRAHLLHASRMADRSNNTFRGAEIAGPPSSTANISPSVRSRKQKLNTEQRQSMEQPTQSVRPQSSSLPQLRHAVPSMQRGAPYSLPIPETLYAEFADLMAQNSSRPEFLSELFRELQCLSCDSGLCQQALQSIREISRMARVDVRSSEAAASQLHPVSREGVGPVTVDDNAATHAIENIVVQHFHEELESSIDVSPESTEGAAALPLADPNTAASRSRPQHPPSLDPCSLNMQSGAVSSGGGHGQLDVEIQGLILQLWPFLKAHREECCSPALLEAIRQHTLSLVPPPASGLNGFIQGQLDALLEDSLLKFQGCWLRDVGEELLAIIAEVLVNEFTFFKLLDTVSRPTHVGTLQPGPDSSNPEQPCQTSGLPGPPSREEMMEVNSDELGAVGPVPGQAALWLPSRLPSSSGWEPRKEAPLTEADSLLSCNGELAEADQSHEGLTEGAPINSPIISCSLVEAAVTSGRNSQAEGIQAEDSSSDAEEDEMDNLDDLGAASLNAGQTPTEDETWNVEQDRDLDQVPTRLEPVGGLGTPPQQQTDANPSSPSHLPQSNSP